MYLPKTKYNVTIAKPGEYTLDGKNYVGPVVTTYLGESYAGSEPSKTKGKLEKIVDPGKYMKIQAVPGRRIPTEAEYEQGVMERYFMQDTRTMKVIELLPDTYESFKKDKPKSYQVLVTGSWILTGSLDDIDIGKYKIPGVRKKNQATIDRLESEVPGISSSLVLNNPEEFVRP